MKKEFYLDEENKTNFEKKTEMKIHSMASKKKKKQ